MKPTALIHPHRVQEYSLSPDLPLHLYHYSPPIGEISNVHIHPFWEIGYCYEGNGLFFVDKKVYSFSAGDVFVISSRQLHKALSLEQASHWIFIYVDLEALLRENSVNDLLLLSSCNPPKTHRNVVRANNASVLHELIHSVANEITEKSEHYKMALRNLFCLFMVNYQRAALRQSDSSTEPSGNQLRAEAESVFRLAPALEHISVHFMQDIPMETLADMCYMSPTTLRREFSSAIGMPPSRYIAGVRIKSALVLLHSTRRKISEIAGEVGFQTLSSFNRTFKSKLGISPSQYRAKNQEK